MDIWILIIAAGSGYLAQSWGSSRSSKEVSGHITDNDNEQSGAPRFSTSARRRYFNSSSRRSIIRRLRQKWRVLPNLSQSGDTAQSDRSEAQVLLAAVKDDACSYPGASKQSERHHDSVQSYFSSCSNISSRCRAVSNFNTIWPQNCCGVVLARQVSKRTSSRLAVSFPETWPCFMSNLYLNDDLDTRETDIMNSHSCRSIVRDGHENSLANEKRAILINRTQRTAGCQDQSEDVCDPGPSNKHILEDCEVRNSRETTPHQEEGENSLTKKERSLPCHRLVNFLGNRAFAKSCHKGRQLITFSDSHAIISHKHPVHQYGENFGIKGLQVMVNSDYSLGDNNSHFSLSRNINSTPRNNMDMPALSRKPRVAISVERDTSPLCLLSQSISEGSNETRRYSLSGEAFELKGSGNNLLDMLLFNFGVGVGIMFAIMSNKHGTWQVIGQLEEAVRALKSLEGEVHGRKKSRLGLGNDRDIRGNALKEQSHSNIKWIQKVLNLVEEARSSLVKDLASVSTADGRCPQERARLEAELEVELERLEMDLDLGIDTSLRDATEVCGRYLLTNKEELEGELSTRTAPRDVDADLSDLDFNDSSHEVMLLEDNCAVPPAELAKRLYEVLEARQESKIMELEAEIKHLDTKLHAKEEEFQAWKQRIRSLMHDTLCISISSLRKDIYVEAENTGKKFRLSSACKEDYPVAAFDSPTALACGMGDFLNDSADIVHSLSRNISQLRTLCSSGADSPNSEGWLQLLNDSSDSEGCSRPLNATGGSSIYSHSGFLKDGEKRDQWNGILKTLHSEVVQVPSGSISRGLSQDATISSTLVCGASCSTTVANRGAVLQDHFNSQLKTDEVIETSCSQKCVNVEEVCFPATLFSSQDICVQEIIDIHDSHRQLDQMSDLSVSVDSFNSWESDEEFGQLLIERIIQKGRKGSLIVEAAKSAMASFDLDDTSLDMEMPCG